MKILLVLAAVVALASCQKEEDKVFQRHFLVFYVSGNKGDQNWNYGSTWYATDSGRYVSHNQVVDTLKRKIQDEVVEITNVTELSFDDISQFHKK